MLVSRLRKSSTSSLQAPTSPENERAVTTPPALEGASKCSNCGTEATTECVEEEFSEVHLLDPA